MNCEICKRPLQLTGTRDWWLVTFKQVGGKEIQFSLCDNCKVESLTKLEIEVKGN